MKKPAAHSKSTTPYICRKCNRTDFRKSMEFTNHLKKCKGLQVETAIAAMGKIHQQSVQTNGLRELLADASRKAGDLKTALDKAIKRLS